METTSFDDSWSKVTKFSYSLSKKIKSRPPEDFKFIYRSQGHIKRDPNMRSSSWDANILLECVVCVWKTTRLGGGVYKDKSPKKQGVCDSASEEKCRHYNDNQEKEIWVLNTKDNLMPPLYCVHCEKLWREFGNLNLTAQLSLLCHLAADQKSWLKI